MNRSKKLWGGRFTGEADEKFAEFNRSFNFDVRLFTADIRSSQAHCAGLHRAGVLSDKEAKQIQNGLQRLLKKAAKETDFFADANAEDIHSFIESRLGELIGEAGQKLHTGRSRNDQVATALRLWLREKIDEMGIDLRETQRSLLD